MMQVRLLGPVDVVVDGLPRPVRGLRRKAVLSVLALRRGEIVSTDRLIELVWGGPGTPSTAVNTLQSHVSHLRQVFGDKTAILARPPGYLLDLGDDSTDFEVAENLIDQGRRSTQPIERVRRMRAALALWRGRPLADVPGLTWLEQQAERLDQLWFQATRTLIEARLALGEHAQLVPDLERLAQDHPLDEEIQGQLILALYRTGRQAEALAAYQRLRQTLAEELGIEPASALRDLETAVLRQDPELHVSESMIPIATGSPTAPPAPTGSTVLPFQLPPEVRAFTGRHRQLADLDATLNPRGATSPGEPATVLIAAVSGTAGVGKTSLAVHWAHAIADQFPDGQLYVNLRGFDPFGPVLDPATALRGFLDALGVPTQRIPSTLDALTALYRSLLAGKRLLVLLDNARSVEQVRPLLPGTAGCLALVTSRDQLTGLVAVEGAHALTLDLLTQAEATSMLSLRLGADRVTREPGAVNDIIDRCARLPLALSIVAARAATHPDFPLAALADELRESHENLDAFSGGDPTSDVRAVISWSYRTLSPAASSLYRLFGLHPGPDLTPAAAASLAGLTPRQIREPLAELTRSHLAMETAPGRYACHDLLCSYAYERAQLEETEQTAQQAIRRSLDHYLHTARSGAQLLYPPGVLFELAETDGVTPEPLADSEQAIAWFTAERGVLLAAVRRAAQVGLDAHVSQLAWALNTYFNQQGRWHDQYAVHAAAVAATGRLGDRPGQARAHRMFAAACGRLELFDDAFTHFEIALDLFTELGDHAGLALVHALIASAYDEQGLLAEAISHSGQSLAQAQAADDAVGQARALNLLGWCHAHAGDHRAALDHCGRGLAILTDHRSPQVEASTLDSIGFAHSQLGDHGQALKSYELALDLWRDCGDRIGEAETFTNMGDTYDAIGDHEAAARSWRDALDILDEVGSPQAEQLRHRLAPVRPA